MEAVIPKEIEGVDMLRIGSSALSEAVEIVFSTLETHYDFVDMPFIVTKRFEIGE